MVKHFLQKGVLAQYSVDPERVVVSGDSAGGNLAAAVSQQVRKLLLFLLCGPCPCTGTRSKPTSVSGSKFVFAKSVRAVRIKGGLGWVYSHPVVFFPNFKRHLLSVEQMLGSLGGANHDKVCEP